MLRVSSAVFGSYLRPDLVPANHSRYDGSSVGTTSNSSVFVNVDNQTEDRYDLGPCLCSSQGFNLCVPYPSTRGNDAALKPREGHTHTHTRERQRHLCLNSR